MKIIVNTIIDNKIKKQSVCIPTKEFAKTKLASMLNPKTKEIFMVHDDHMSRSGFGDAPMIIRVDGEYFNEIGDDDFKLDLIAAIKDAVCKFEK